MTAAKTISMHPSPSKEGPAVTITPSRFGGVIVTYGTPTREMLVKLKEYQVVLRKVSPEWTARLETNKATGATELHVLPVRVLPTWMMERVLGRR